MKSFFSLAIVFALQHQSACASSVEDNKRLVREFYELAFNAHEPRKAALEFIGEPYIQHNPYALDGKEAFVNFFEAYYRSSKTARVEVKRMIAEGDLVVVHVHSREHSLDQGRAVVDIFRVVAGKIVEHWDVSQEIPKNQANGNTMF